MTEIETLKKRIAELEDENLRLKAGAGMTFLAGSVVRTDTKTSNMTVAGIEEMVLLISRDNSLSYVNGPMGKLLGMTDRKSVLGRPLAEWDRLPGAEGTLLSLVNMAREGDGALTVEPPLNHFPVERLPDPAAARPAGPIFLRITAFRTGDKVQISIQETTRLKWLEKTFSRYLPKKIIEQLQFVSDDEVMRPQRANVTMLFADLRGFTAISERISPEDVSRIVSSFLGEMVAVINEMDGTVDKFVGDEIVAMFGAPQKQPDHAVRALIAATRMMERHTRWMATQTAKGEPAPQAGIGIATGDVVIGNIGTEDRSDFTAIGHAVNLASRLCGSAPGGMIYTVPETYAAASAAMKLYLGPIPLPKIGFDPVGDLTFKNVSKPVKVLSVRVG
ncbi:MAG TPA: adenylate/guanylate cyclase domain-containing protein [bacterium]|nr:adenylate/guanylate cyclase domain-containing protein [bacterium]